MKTFTFEANGLEYGEWIAQTQEHAQDAFASDSGYKDWADMCERADEYSGNTVEVKELT